MNLKKYMIAVGYTLGLIAVFTIIISILNYFELINNTVFNILKLVIPIVSTMVGGFLIGKSSDRNGYQSGIKFGLVYSGIAVVIDLIFYKINFNFFVFIAIIIIASMFGSMIGINKRATSK